MKGSVYNGQDGIIHGEGIVMPLRLLSIVSILLFALGAQAKDGVIFEIRRPISLKPGQPEPKDFYINAGKEIGLKKNMLIVVNRRTTLYDSYKNNSPGDLYIPVGQIRIIHVQKGLSVARLEKMVTRNHLPHLEYDSIMVGDQLDMETAKMTSRKTASYGPQPMERLEAGPSDSADFSSLAPSAESLVTIPLQTL